MDKIWEKRNKEKSGEQEKTDRIVKNVACFKGLRCTRVLIGFLGFGDMDQENLDKLKKHLE